MAEQCGPPPVASSSPFSLSIPRPSLPRPEWLGSVDFWGVQRKEDLQGGFGIQSQELRMEEPGASDPIECVPSYGGWAWPGRFAAKASFAKDGLLCQPSIASTSSPMMAATASALPSPISAALFQHPCQLKSELLNTVGLSNIPVAKSEKWEERVQGLGDSKICRSSKPTVSKLHVGPSEHSSPILFRRLSGNVGNDEHDCFTDGALGVVEMKPADQLQRIEFDLNCLPDEENSYGSKSPDSYINHSKKGKFGESSGLDLMQFVDPSIEDTCSSYSLSDSEEAEREEELQQPNIDAGESGDCGIGVESTIPPGPAKISAASSTGSTNCVETGDEVNGPRKKRHYSVEGPNEREKLPGKKSALEMALMKFADRTTPYIIDPAVGTEFDCVTEAFDYYNLYSWEVGFGIKYGKTKHSQSKKYRYKDPTDMYVLSVELRCCCAGVPNKGQKISAKLGCGAMIRLHRTQDHGYVVVEHRTEHNHPLSGTCGEKRQWPSHKRIDKHTKDLVRILRENNLGLTKIYSILGSFFGSMSNVPTTKRNLRAVCQKISREEAEEDIKKTLLVFREMREADPGFLYSVDPDDEGRIKSLMWTSSRSRMQYAHFGDVVTFDTTYRTNLYDMPFGMFVGVNNHFQSVLFAGVLLTEETIESFRWVFKEFISMMGGKKPQTILTDQCRAMEVAISIEWEEVAHRWCKWHVLKRVGECLGTKYTSKKDFRDKFHKMLNEMLTKEEFKKAWKELLAEYGLSKNTFLEQIYKTRKKWVKCYFKDVFCAKQTSTQRSECANHMVKNLVPPGCTIHHFVRQYAKLLHTIDDSENYEERRTKLFTRDLSMGGPLIAQAAKVYTYKVFGMFCKVKTESEDYFAKEIVEGKEYVTEHYNLDKVQRWCKGRYVVKVNSDRTMFTCECGMFEHFGLPCCHSLRVMISIGLKAIPEAMIMRRWTRKARLILPAHLAKYGEPNPALMAQTYRHAALFLAALELVKLGDSNVRCFHVLMACFAAAKEKLIELSKEKDGLGLEEREAAKDNAAQQNAGDQREDVDGVQEDLFPLRAPKRKRGRGRPTNAREKPAYENLSKRPKFCRTCKGPDHRSDTCPLRDKTLDRPRAPPTCRRCGLEGHMIATCGSEKQIATMAAAI